MTHLLNHSSSPASTFARAGTRRGGLSAVIGNAGTIAGGDGCCGERLFAGQGFGSGDEVAPEPLDYPGSQGNEAMYVDGVEISPVHAILLDASRNPDLVPPATHKDIGRSGGGGVRVRGGAGARLCMTCGDTRTEKLCPNCGWQWCGCGDCAMCSWKSPAGGDA